MKSKHLFIGGIADGCTRECTDLSKVMMRALKPGQKMEFGKIVVYPAMEEQLYEPFFLHGRTLEHTVYAPEGWSHGQVLDALIAAYKQDKRQPTIF